MGGREIYCDIAAERAPRPEGGRFDRNAGGGGFDRNAGGGGFDRAAGRTSDGTTVFVKGFDKYAGEDAVREELTRLFSDKGAVKAVRLPTDRETGELKGIAFVEFADAAGKNAAVDLDGAEAAGGWLKVDPNVGGGGGGGGGGFGGGRDGGGFGGRGGGRGGFGGSRRLWRPRRRRPQPRLLRPRRRRRPRRPGRPGRRLQAPHVHRGRWWRLGHQGDV